MKTKSHSLLWLATLLLTLVAARSPADTDGVTDTPGFRPASEMADTFLSQLDSSRIAVLPTVIRTQTSTMTSDVATESVVAFLKDHKLGIPETQKLEMSVGELKGNGQFEWFQNDQGTLSEIVKTQTGADYYLVLEHLIPRKPSGEIEVFGIHIYVLDANGNNAFSFLLNSHHKNFVEAGLTSADSSEAGYKALASKATPVALDALLEQIQQARKNGS